MYLKQLDLHGFKTFAERTQIVFSPGITCVVGPNGAGKSNIADAILWVLGENNVRELRGATNQDVIFAGNEKRRPIGMAEASLTIDNTGRMLPLGFSEVTVTRRVYRSGETECFINRTPVRLKDVYELFLDTGIGRDAYAMIGQGEIDQILSVRAEDRRAVFEEAAGIKKYRVRKREAERKLENTQQNLVRIHDILAEIEGQLGPLKRQAAATGRYRDLAGRLRRLEHAWYGGRLTRLAAEEQRLAALLGGLQEETARFEAEQAAVRHAAERRRAAIQALDERRAALQGEERDALQELVELQAERARTEERVQETGRRLRQLAQELQGIDERLAGQRERAERTAAEEADLIATLEALRCDLQRAADAAAEAARASAAAGASLEDLRRAAAAHAQHLARLHRERQGLQERTAGHATLEERLVRELQAHAAEAARGEAELEAACSAVRTLDERVIATTERHVALQAEQAELNARLRVQAAASRQAKEALDAARARRDALAELGERGEGAEEGARCLLEAVHRGELPGDWALLSDRLRIAPGREAAWEAALGPYRHAVLCPDAETALAGVELLRQRGHGALLLPGLPPPGPRPTGGSLLDELPADPALPGPQAAAWLEVLLGQAVTVADLQAAFDSQAAGRAEQRIWISSSGVRLDPTGAVSLCPGAGESGRSFLNRRWEIERLGAEMPALEAECDRLQAEAAAGDEERRLLAAQIGAVESERAAAQAERRTVQRDVERRREDQTRSAQRAAHMERELQEVRRQSGVTADALSRLNLELDALHTAGEEDRHETALRSAEELRVELEEERRARDQAVSELRIHVAREEHRLTGLQETIRRNTEWAATLHRQKEERLQEQRDLGAARDQQVLTFTGHEEGSEALTRRAVEARQAQEALGLEREAEEKLLEGGHREIEKLDARLREISERRHAVQLEAAAVQTEYRSTARLWLDAAASAHSLEADEAGASEAGDGEPPPPEEFSIESLLGTWSPAAAQEVLAAHTDPEGKISRLRRQIRGLGPINPDAVEQYAATQARYEFLTAQDTDLREAREKLIQTIREIDQVSRETFLTAFQEIAGAFDRMFRTLFGGGRTELKLTDPDDVLESGIEIVVQPPGKRQQNLLLLSGGERALTAAAMLFALLTVRPSPFCVLDEIDAALDESNVRRFCDVLREFSHRTQFIVVTHNRGTMEAASTLYGVTMEESGVSRVLSCSLDDPVTRTGESQ